MSIQTFSPCKSCVWLPLDTEGILKPLCVYVYVCVCIIVASKSIYTFRICSYLCLPLKQIRIMILDLVWDITFEKWFTKLLNKMLLVFIVCREYILL